MNPLPQGLTLRYMTTADVDAVHALDSRSFSLPWPRRSFVFEITENKASHCWVAELDEDGEKYIIGVIVCWLLVDEIHIATIAVDPNYRRKGIATAMLLFAITKLAAKGAKQATLEVRQSNFAAQSMYRKFGFVVVGQRRAYYKDTGEDALLMTLYQIDPDKMSGAAPLLHTEGA